MKNNKVCRWCKEKPKIHRGDFYQVFCNNKKCKAKPATNPRQTLEEAQDDWKNEKYQLGIRSKPKKGIR